MTPGNKRCLVLSHSEVDYNKRCTLLWCMARPLTLPIRMILRLPPDMPDRIAAMLTDGENATLFIRRSIEVELKRRERATEKRKTAGRANV
jgi:hypothetical protein